VLVGGSLRVGDEVRCEPALPHADGDPASSAAQNGPARATGGANRIGRDADAPASQRDALERRLSRAWSGLRSGARALSLFLACGSAAAQGMSAGDRVPWARPDAAPATRPAAGGTVRLPQRNLQVEWREVEASQAAASQAGVHAGGWSVGSDGRVQGGLQGGVVQRSRDAAGERVQQVQVLNGGRASIGVSRAVPWQVYEVAWTARGPAVVGSTLWSQVGQRFSIEPRWPGGEDPATVVLSSGAAGSPGRPGELGLDPAPARHLETTLQLPLGDWVTVARSASSSRDGGRDVGTGGVGVGTRSSTAEWELQLRITAP
jgi:hypothetical protein